MGRGDQCGQTLRNMGILWEISPLNVANWTLNESNRIGLWARFPVFLWPLWAFAAPKWASFPQFLIKHISFSPMALTAKKTWVLEAHTLVTNGLPSFLNFPSVAKSLKCYHTNFTVISCLQYSHSCALQVGPKLLQHPSKVLFCFQPHSVPLSSQREAVGVSSSSPTLHGSPQPYKSRTKFPPWHLNPSKTWFSSLYGLRTIIFLDFYFPISPGHSETPHPPRFCWAG